jgi:hypothetical protein
MVDSNIKEYPDRFAWGNNEKRKELKDRYFKILERGAMNSALVEFEDGSREIISRNAIRRRTDDDGP